MAHITRGYSFTSTEEVTNIKLGLLVTNAAIDQLSWSEFAGGIIGISVFSALSNVSVGWISAEYENLPLTASTYSGIYTEFTYMLQSPTGRVALFKNGGYETRRFVAAHGGLGGPFILGGGYHVSTPAAGVTLTVNTESGSNNEGNAHCVGSNAAQTATTSPTDFSGVPRIVMKGYTGIRNDTTNQATTEWRRYVFQGNNADGRFTSTASTSIDKILGLEFSFGGQDSVRPAWLWGAPVWRL